MGFHEIRFPAALSFGSLGGPERRTDVVTMANGFEERNTPWAHSRRRYDAGMGLQSLDDIGDVIAFFEARRGRLYGFRWKDWSDYKSGRPMEAVSFLDQDIGTGNGSSVLFSLSKTYTSGDESYLRPVAKPVAASVRVAVDGIEIVLGMDAALDAATGAVIFASAPLMGAVITAGFEFDVPVRFDTDQIQTSVASFNAGEVPSVPVVEVRV